MSVLSAIEATRARDYGDGVVDGMIITLELLLGNEQHDVSAFQGEISPELRAWAEKALKKAKEQK